MSRRLRPPSCCREGGQGVRGGGVTPPRVSPTFSLSPPTAIVSPSHHPLQPLMAVPSFTAITLSSAAPHSHHSQRAITPSSSPSMAISPPWPSPPHRCHSFLITPTVISPPWPSALQPSPLTPGEPQAALRVPGQFSTAMEVPHSGMPGMGRPVHRGGGPLPRRRGSPSRSPRAHAGTRWRRRGRCHGNTPWGRGRCRGRAH